MDIVLWWTRSDAPLFLWQVPLRLTPEYRFEYDDAVDEADLVGGNVSPTCVS